MMVIEDIPACRAIWPGLRANIRHGFVSNESLSAEGVDVEHADFVTLPSYLSL